MGVTIVDYEKPLLHNLALLGAALFGFYAGVKVVEMFKPTLQPLVYSTLVAGLVEDAVQLCEWGLQKIAVLVCCAFSCECWTGKPCFKRDTLSKLEEKSEELLSSRSIEEDVGKTEPASPKKWQERFRKSWREEEDVGKNSVIRLFAVIIALTGVSVLTFLFIFILKASLTDVEWSNYAQGFVDLQNATMNSKMIKPLLKNNLIDANFTQRFKEEGEASIVHVITFASNYMSAVLSNTTTLLFQCVMFLLYTLMWLLVPDTSNKKLFSIIKVYLSKKTFCNTIFGACVYLLLHCLNVELALAIAIICGAFSYIPEVGAFVGIALPLPFILLDHKLSIWTRFSNVIIGSLGGVLIKFLISNGLESFVMGQKEGKQENHPVIVLFFVLLMGDIWGITGMFISIPVLSLINIAIELHDGTKRDTDTPLVRLITPTRAMRS